MKRVLCLVFVGVLFATPAMAQKVSTEYAHGFDFKSVKTYQYVDTTVSNVPNRAVADRVTATLEKELAKAGLTETTEKPDIFITYHYAAKAKTSFNTTDPGLGGYGGYWDGWRGWRAPATDAATVTEPTYRKGTLIFDAYEAKGKKLVWRGTGVVSASAEPAEQLEIVDTIVVKLGKTWKKILAGKGEGKMKGKATTKGEGKAKSGTKDTSKQKT